MIRMHNPAHPGELIREYLGSIPVGETAKRLRVARSTLSRLLNGRASLRARAASAPCPALVSPPPHVYAP